MYARQIALIPLLIIAAITASEMATDIFVPSLPYLTHFFDVREETISLTISMYMLGFSLSGPFYGPLSDAFGRRPVFIIGMILFTLTSFACAFSPSVEWLIALRALQGFGGGVTVVVGTAILKDLYDGEECARMMSLMGIAMSASPGIAPLIGGYVANAYHWESVFFLVFAFAAVTLVWMYYSLRETLPKADRQPLCIMQAVHNYREIISNRSFMAYALMCSLSFAVLWAYISSTTFYFISVLGYSMEQYGFFQAFLVSIYILGSLINNRLLRFVKLRTLLSYSLVLFVLGGGVLVLGTWWAPDSGYAISAAMIPMTIAMSIVFPNAATLSLDVFPDMGGAASAMLSFLEMAAGALMVYLIQIIYTGSFMPVAFAMWFVSFLIGGLFLINRGVEPDGDMSLQ